MKHFEEPTIDVTEFNVADIITASSAEDNEVGRDD